MESFALARAALFIRCLLLLLFFAGVFARIQPITSSASGVTAIVATVAAPSLANAVLGGQSQKQCMIFLPSSYADSDRRYPTIYFLAGAGSFASTYRYIFTSETIVKDVIIVVADGQHSVIGNSHYTNSPVTGNWEDFITYDVVNYVDANYRTIDSSDFRGIAGFSMGGWGALAIAMKHPEVFGAIYAIAPPMFDENGLWETVFCSDIIKTRVLDLLDSLSGLNASEAHNRYVSTLNSLYFNDDLQVTLAYGSAYAFDLTIGAPYFRYMYYRNASGHVELNQTVVEAWENGRGNLEDKIPFFRQNLLCLNGIAIEYGLADSNWLQRGCEYFSQIATAQGINHSVIRTNYGHFEDVARFRDYMMPFFWEIFTVSVRVVINEVELNPPGDDYDHEWVELLNPTKNPVDIGGWAVSTTAGRTSTVNIPTGTMIQPCGYWVVTCSGQWLDNENNECIVLYDASGLEIDRTPLLNDTDNDSKSRSRYANGVDTDSDSDWTFQISTKGTANLVGDIDGDGEVDMWDLASIAKLFGRTSGDILWNTRADINGDNIMNMADLGIAAKHFGEHYP